jgi:hypothetical protein
MKSKWSNKSPISAIFCEDFWIRSPDGLTGFASRVIGGGELWSDSESNMMRWREGANIIWWMMVVEKRKLMVSLKKRKQTKLNVHCLLALTHSGCMGHGTRLNLKWPRIKMFRVQSSCRIAILQYVYNTKMTQQIVQYSNLKRIAQLTHSIQLDHEASSSSRYCN